MNFGSLTSWDPASLSPGRLATLACLLEVTAPKPGNVHRGADFEDVTFLDFVTSAVVLGNDLDHAIESKLGLGEAILQAVQNTIAAVGSNTNLGMVLLLAPLAFTKSSFGEVSVANIQHVLNGLDEDDCRLVYEAIRIANPGGLGGAKSQDVNEQPPSDLVKAMELAAQRDRVALQYSSGFRDCWDHVVPSLREGMKRFGDPNQAIVFAHVKQMSVFADSLIARKNDEATAEHSRFLAAKAIDHCERSEGAFWEAVSDLDFWLRSDGNRRNPGTTADLIAAGLFLGLSEGKFSLKNEEEN